MNPDPLTTKPLPFQTTDKSWSWLSRGLRAQAAPSELVSIVPDSPTATNREPFQAMSRIVLTPPTMLRNCAGGLT